MKMGISVCLVLPSPLAPSPSWHRKGTALEVSSGEPVCWAQTRTLCSGISHFSSLQPGLAHTLKPVLKRSWLIGGMTWGDDVAKRRADGSGWRWLGGFPQRQRCDLLGR